MCRNLKYTNSPASFCLLSYDKLFSNLFNHNIQPHPINGYIYHPLPSVKNLNFHFPLFLKLSVSFNILISNPQISDFLVLEHKNYPFQIFSYLFILFTPHFRSTIKIQSFLFFNSKKWDLVLARRVLLLLQFHYLIHQFKSNKKKRNPKKSLSRKKSLLSNIE